MDTLLFKIEVQGLTEDITLLGKLKGELIKIAESQKTLDKAFKDGKISVDAYNQQTGILKLRTDAVRQEMTALNKELNSQTQEFRGAVGSMTRLGQELAANRQRYRDLSAAERENAQIGGQLLQTIQKQDTELKKLDAGMGNYHRNVGNYRTATADLMGQMVGFTGVVGLAVAAFGGLKRALEAGVRDAMEEEKAHQRLVFALNGDLTAIQRMSEFRDNLKENTLFSKDEINNAINYALSLGRSEAETRNLVTASLGLARATGTDVQSSLQQLQGTYEGVKGRLAKYNGEISNMTDEQLRAGAAVEAINDKLGKFASAGIETASGKLEQAKKQWREFWETISKPFILLGGEIGSTFNNLFSTSSVQQYRKEIQSLDLHLTVLNHDLRINAGYLRDDPGNETRHKRFNDLLAEIRETEKLIRYNYWMIDSKQKIREGVNDLDAYARQLGVTTKELQKMSIAEIVAKLPYTIDEKTDKRMQDRIEKERKDNERLVKETENREKKIRDTIYENSQFLLNYSRQTMDAEIATMQDGKEKEIAEENDKFQDTRIQIETERDEKIKAINDVIKETKASGENLKQLEKQKTDITIAAMELVEKKQDAHQKTLLDIEKKYSNAAKNDELLKKYDSDVAQVEEEGALKLEVLRKFYADKGTLTKEEETKLANEEKKIALEVAQKKYDLLYQEIQARRKLGTITPEEYAADLEQIKKLYGEVQKLSGGDSKAKGKAGNKITSGLAKMLSIDESDASKIMSQVENLLNNIMNMYEQYQQQRIKAELNAEKAKLDKGEKSEQESLEYRRKKGLITEAQYESEKQAITDKYDKKRQEAEKRAFEQQKKLAITMAIINGALALVRVWAESDWITALVMSVLIAANTAIQIATISGQKYEEYGRGGMVTGKSHKKGGEKFAVGGRVIELEGGEAVINKRSMASNDFLNLYGTPREIASILNSYNGYGVPFDPGGYRPVNTPATQGVNISNRGQFASDIARMLNDKRVIVVSTDITDQQSKDQKVIVESTW